MIAAGVEEVIARTIRKELDKRRWWEKLRGEGAVLAPRLAAQVIEELRRLQVDVRFAGGAAVSEADRSS